MGARQGSTSARRRLAKARELEAKRRLTRADRRNLARLETKGKGEDKLTVREQRQLSELRTKRSSGPRLKREQLTKKQQLEFSRITSPGAITEAQAVAARRPREFASARAVASPAVQPVGATTINMGGITIMESNDPDVTRRVVNKAVEDAVADAGAALARGVR